MIIEVGNPWVVLIFAGLFEVGFTTCLGEAKEATGIMTTIWIIEFRRLLQTTPSLKKEKSIMIVSQTKLSLNKKPNDHSGSKRRNKFLDYLNLNQKKSLPWFHFRRELKNGIWKLYADTFLYFPLYKCSILLQNF